MVHDTVHVMGLACAQVWHVDRMWGVGLEISKKEGSTWHRCGSTALQGVLNSIRPVSSTVLAVFP